MSSKSGLISLWNIPGRTLGIWRTVPWFYPILSLVGLWWPGVPAVIGRSHGHQDGHLHTAGTLTRGE